MRLRQALKVLKNRARRPCRDHTWLAAYRRVHRHAASLRWVKFHPWWDSRTGRLSYS